MKVIVAGSRHLVDVDHVVDAIWLSPFQITEIVSGLAHGPDTSGVIIASRYGLPVQKFPAAWRTQDEKFNKAAGMHRNAAMAAYADALIAVWDGHSSGTRDMIARMKKMGKPVFVHMPA